MSSRKPEHEVLALLHVLRQAASQEQPSAGVEVRLLEEFHRRQAAEGAALEQPNASRLAWRFRGPVGAWLAAAAALLLVVAGAVGWRAGHGRPEAGETAAVASTREGRPPVAAEPMRADMRAPAALRTAATAAVANGQAKVLRGVKRPVSGDQPIEFVAWPGAAALPSLESGELVRTELPAAVVPLLGLASGVRAGRATVPADVIVGQDGRPRAVRLVSDGR